MVFISKT